MRRPAPAGGSLRLIGTLAALALALTGCTGDGTSGTDSTPVPTLPPPPAPSPDPVETPCLSASPDFAARGTVSVLGRSDPDARQLSALDWILTPGCERVVFGFLTDEAAPASSAGLTRLEFFPTQAIVRITMPRDVTVTGIADAAVGGELIRRAFVVRSRSGELSVDLHVDPGTPVEARGLLIGSPARLAVDVRPTTREVPAATAAPIISDRVVLLSPVVGDAEYPLRIRGYARTPDDLVTTLIEARGPTADRLTRRAPAAPSHDAWGAFAATIARGEGPVGSITLTVGIEPVTADEGVSIELAVR